MEFVEKVAPQNPVAFTKGTIDELAEKIRAQKIDNPYNSFPNYFFFTVSPNGKIYLPNKKLCGHPQITEFQILKEDPLLRFILDKCVSERYEADDCGNIQWSILAVLFGYIHISGWGLVEEKYKCTYNPFALNYVTKKIPSSINFNTISQTFTDLRKNSEENLKTKYYTFTNSWESSEEQVKDSIRIPFFKKQLEKRCESRRLNPNQIYEAFNSDEIEEYVRKLNERFEKIFRNLLRLLGYESFEEILDNGLDIFEEISKNETISKIIETSPIEIIDYLESYKEFTSREINNIED